MVSNNKKFTLSALLGLLILVVAGVLSSSSIIDQECLRPADDEYSGLLYLRFATWITVAIVGCVTAVAIHKLVKARNRNRKLARRLQRALAENKRLSGLLPICASCKNIRDEKGCWNRIEYYIEEHSEAQFTHGICPDCANKIYPE